MHNTKWYSIRRCMSHTPLGRLFQPRLLDNQEGANTERYVFRKLSARRGVSNVDLFGTGGTIPAAVEMPSLENRPRGGVIFCTQYTVLKHGDAPYVVFSSIYTSHHCSRVDLRCRKLGQRSPHILYRLFYPSRYRDNYASSLVLLLFRHACGWSWARCLIHECTSRC